ncbi:hypothetical protein [Mesorhizobium sp. B2-5-9]|uniref:hypothetical protein n=1 Tax=Mesorhizobium sp. B2-5-9 TaxID=2589921 RepID=UPI0015E32926|nr:hypothetical protein [Mesorhizobium sp. B2-5-9]
MEDKTGRRVRLVFAGNFSPIRLIADAIIPARFTLGILASRVRWLGKARRLRTTGSWRASLVGIERKIALDLTISVVL